MVGRALIGEPGYALCIKFYALAVTHWKHVTSERGFDDADSGREGKPDTEKPKGQLPSYHLTTTANPLRTQPHSQSESVHNSGTMFTDNYMGGSFPHWQTAPARRTRKSGSIGSGALQCSSDERCILAACVAPPSNTGGILGRRALPVRRLTRLCATPDFHHDC